MKRHLVYGKDDYNLLVLNKSESNTETIDQEHTDASQVTGVFYKVPIVESTKTNEREYKTSLTYAKKYRPFSIQLYNEILHRNIFTKSTEQTETQVNRNRFKLPVSKQYDPENLNWKHEEEEIGQEINPNKEINDQETINNGSKAHAFLITDKEDNIKDLKRTARKIVIENLEKVVSKRKEIKKDNTELNTENGRYIVKWQNDSQPSLMVKGLKQENISSKKLLDETSDISKFVKGTVHIYESIDTELEIKKEIKDERKLFLLQEIEETIEEGSVKKKSTLFENKKQTTIKGRQLEMIAVRKAFSIGSGTILRIKRQAESRLSNFLLKIFYLHLTNLLIKLTRYISYKQLYRSRMEEHLKTKLTNDQSIKKTRLSSADIVQLVSGKSIDWTEKMDTVISELHSKLHMNKDGKDYERRAKSVSRIDEVTNTKTYDWLSEMDIEEREQIREEIKLATLAAARRMLGRRRSYHNLTDIENEKLDGLTYIAIVESHVYTNKNAIFDDYISRLKTQVNNVLEITDVNEMIATECTEGKYYKFSSNQGYLRDKYMKNTADFQCKESIDEVQNQRIDYVATVTVEHKQKPVISMEKAQKSVEMNSLSETAWTTDIDIEESEVKEITAKAEDRIEANKTENLNEIVIPTPIIEEMELTRSINEATSNQINEIFDVQKVTVTEVKEELPIVNTDSTELIKAQARSVETTGEIKTDLLETKEHGISYAINASTAVVKENKVIAEEIVPVVVEVKEDVGNEATAVFDFAEASSLTLTELKEQLPTITVQEELSKAQIFNKECVRQSSEVYNGDIKAIESYNLSEDKGVLNRETEKVIATKVVNETYIHEEPIELPKTEIESDISANSTIEESQYESALSMSCGLLSELTTNIDTAVITEDVEIKQKALSLNKEIFQDINVPVEEGETIIIHVPTNEEAVIKKEDNMLSTVLSVATAFITQVNINLFEANSFDNESMIEEHALYEEEKGDYYFCPPVCTSLCQYLKLNLEECSLLEIDQILEELATISNEEDVFVNAISICTSITDEINTIYIEAAIIAIEDLPEEKIEISEEKNNYSTAVLKCNEIYEIIELLLEDTNELIIDRLEEELAVIQIQSQIFVNILETTTIYIEAELLPEVRSQEEIAELSEEKNHYFNPLITCNDISQDIKLILEETNDLIINKLDEEIASIQIEPKFFLTALSIFTSTLSDITTVYFETGILTEEKFQEVNAEVFIEENHCFTALKACIEISQYIELLLEESNELAIEEFGLELAAMSVEPFVLENTIPLSTSILSQINEELYEANILEIKRIEEEEANVLEEVSKLTLILAICIAAIEEIYKDLEECSSFKVDEIKEEIVSYKEEPLVLLRILPKCVSILEDINMSYNSAEVLEIIQLRKENADSNIEDKYFVTILCLCTSIVETVITKLDEVNSFNVDQILEYRASEYLEPKIFSKTLPKCIATVFTLNIPLFEVKLLEDEVFEQMTVSASLVTKDYATAKTLCQAIVQDEVLNEVEKTSLSYEVEEDYANLSYEDELSSTYAVRAATARQLDIKYDFADNYESNLEQEQINTAIETHHFTTAQSINNATAINECVNLHTINEKESNNFVEETAVIKIEPKHKSVSILEANVKYEDNANVIVKSRKKKNIEAVSEIKNEFDTINIKRATLVENIDNFKHIAELKDNKSINEQVIRTEEPVHLMTQQTVTIGRKKSIKQKASKDIYQESNVQSNIDVEPFSKTIKNTTDVKSNIVAESMVENLRETSTSISLQQAEENEANVNISIRKAKAKKIDNQEMSYKLTLTKPQVTDQTVLDTKEETLYIKRKKSLNQYQIEEFEDEFNLSLDHDNESGVVIQEISDSDEDNDIEEGNQSMDVSLESKLQSDIQDASKDVYETTTFVKQRNKDYNWNEESSALTIFKKEDVDLPVVENYEEDLSTIINTFSNDRSEYVGSIEISSLSGIESSAKGVVEKAFKRQSKTNDQSHEEKIGNGFKDSEMKAFKISTTESSFEKSIKMSLESTEFVSDTVLNKSKSLTLKTDLKREEIELSEDNKSNESSPDIESPSKPPTPLTDEYIFRLIAPLPKSRGSTPAPEPSPDIIDKNQYIVNKNLVPTLESVAIERIVYDPPLPTPPTSPVHSTYVKPGLNGGMKRVPRYFKPGLRGGYDRPPIPKEEILEVRKTLSTLTSDINETLKNIEKYKKLVEILKQQKGEGESSKMMEEDEKIDKQTKPEEIDKDAEEKETSEQTITEKSIQPSETGETKIEPNSETDNIVDDKKKNEKTDSIKMNIKEDITNKMEEARIKSYNITEVTSFEEIEKECDDTGIVELAPDTAGIRSIEKEFSIITEDSEAERPETDVQIKIELDKEIDKSEDKVDASDEEQKAADEEVASVTELTADIIPTKEISPVDTSPSEADTIKEAHVISLTRVLSSHMIREGLSPDCQKMKDKFENNKNVPEKIEDRSWTTFLQKSTNLQTQKMGHFADLQNKFENQVPFTTKLTDRNELRLSPVIKPRDFNSSPVPWQERVMADNLGASNLKSELTPGEEPKFFLAIPTECKDTLKSTVIPLPNSNEELFNIELNKLNDKGKSEHTVVEIIQDAMNFIDNLNIGDGRNRMIQLLLEKIKNIADSNIPIEEQLMQMKKQLETLEKVPDIIKGTLDNVAEKIHLLNKTLAMLQLRTIWQSFWQLFNDAVLFCYVDTSCLAEHRKKEDALQTKEFKYQKELEPIVTITTEISEEKPQIIKEERKVEKMSAQTKGQLLVHDKKNFASQMNEQFTNKPQQKFGWMKPEPRPIKLFGGRRWRRPGEEYTEEQIAETILAHSELIHGKTMGINFMKYEKPPIPLDHLQHSEVFKMIHNTEQTPQKPVEFRRTVIAEADYRERCRSLSPCPPESSINYKSTF